MASSMRRNYQRDAKIEKAEAAAAVNAAEAGVEAVMRQDPASDVNFLQSISAGFQNADPAQAAHWSRHAGNPNRSDRRHLAGGDG